MRRSGNRAVKLPFARSADGTLNFGPFSGIPAIDKHYQEKEEGYSSTRIAACFLGNKAENEDVLVKCVFDAIYRMCKRRRLFYPGDPTPVTPSVEAAPEFQEMVSRMEEAAAELVGFLNKYSLPFYSMRYQGHMNWDTTLPSIIGYFTAMLDNPNNVSIQGATATTLLERMVGLDICGMIGFDLTGDTKPWAHITCDGTVANAESVWSTRELKFLPLAVQDSQQEGEAFEKTKDDLVAAMPDGTPKKVCEMDTWELINLTCDEILKIPGKIAALLHPGSGPEHESEVWEILMHTYSLGARGFLAFAERFTEDGVGSPVVIVPSSKHYSWPKSTSVLGLGYESKLFEETVPPRKGLLNVPVDADARMDRDALADVLNDCLDTRTPVLQVVAVMGSTEESAVDPLDDIIDLREKYRTGKVNSTANRLMDFNIHADAAWGGYLLSAVRKPYQIPTSMDGVPITRQSEPAEDDPFDPSGVLLSDHTLQHMMAIRNCDSVTIDPHKWGYVPYPAGSLSYRNGMMTNLVTFGAPYIGSSTEGAANNLSMGESGIEGSKPGAAAAAVFLSHRVLRPDRNGYGQLMQGALFNAKVFFLHLLRVGVDFDEKRGVNFRPYILRQNDLPASFWSNDLIRQFMDHEISDRDFVERLSLAENLDLIRSIGPDQSTLAYAFNKRGNTDLEFANYLNCAMFHNLYPNPTTEFEPIPIDQFDMFVTMTTFKGDEYGEAYMEDFAKGLGVDLPDPKTSEINCLRSVVMDPWMVNTLDIAEDFVGSTLIPALLDAADKADGELVIESCRNRRHNMSKILDDYFDPKAVHDHFMKITQEAHCSCHENSVREYVVECAGKIHNVDVVFYERDATAPCQRIIVLRRKGAGDYADVPYVTLQAHMDMVCWPNGDIFPLHVFGYGDDQGVKWIKAGEEESVDDPQRGTTLGADDGIGVATILAILEDESLKDYPIECLFTVQEEIDMGGAKCFDPSLLIGRRYISLDAEDAPIIIYGSAGGCNVRYEGTVTRSDMPDHFTTLKVSVSGLCGGHSGININKGRLNAIKVLTEALIRLNKRLTNLEVTGGIASYDLRLASMTRDEEPTMNAIPSCASAVIVLPMEDKDSFEGDFKAYCEALKAQYQSEEEGFDWEVEQQSAKEQPMDESSTDALLCLLQQIPHGVIRMIPDNSALVETSTNLAAIHIEGNKVVIRSSDRSSNDQSLTVLTCIQKMIGCCFDFKVLESDGYPAWQPNKDSELLKKAKAVYAEVYGDDSAATVIHAGLECGYVVQKYGAEMECIAIGPTIVDPHSGCERLQASTVEQFYGAVTSLLQELFSK